MTNYGIKVKGNWKALDVIINTSGIFSPSSRIKNHIEKVWDDVVLKHPKIFNGSLLRLKEYRSSNDTLELITEKTDFASYIATRDPSFELLSPNEKRADPIGMNIVSVTQDGKIIITRRSLTSEHNPGTLNFIGGYVDPTITDTNNKINLDQQVKRELKEELNISENEVKEIVVQGIGYDPYVCHFEIFTVALLDQTSKQIEDRWRSAVDAKEANKVIFIEKSELLKKADEQDLPYPPCWSFSTGVYLLKQHFQ